MDGLLLLAFVLPGLVAFNLTLSVLAFFFSLVVSFGPSVAQVLSENANNIHFTWTHHPVLSTLTSWIPQDVVTWVSSTIFHLLRIIPTSTTTSPSLWPQILVSVVTTWTVLSTYGVGGALRYGKRGWRFVQPCAGGPRFVLLQFCTWTTTAVALVLPWTTVKDLGWLLFLEKVERNDTQASNGMLVAGAALGMLSNSLCVLALMSFESSIPPITFQGLDRNLRLLETARIKNRVLFGSDSTLWWWLFLILQGALVVFSLQLAFMLETNPMRNKLIEATLLMVVTALTAVPTAITNAIGGKWRHGETTYRLLMPFKGGARFIGLQALGWSSYAAATTVTLTKLYEITFGSSPWGGPTLHERSSTPIALAAMTGVFAYVCIFASLFFFESPEPTTTTNGTSEESDDVSLDQIDESDYDDDDENTALEIATVLGKRRGKIAGTVDYLIQWKRAVPTPNQTAMKPTWMNERNLSNQALRLCEQMCPTPKGKRTSSSSSGKKTSKGRSTSPPLVRNGGGGAATTTSMVSTFMSPEKTVRAGGMLLSSPRESVMSMDDWEELEDENGNAFFFNPKTGESRRNVSPVGMSLSES